MACGAFSTKRRSSCGLFVVAALQGFLIEQLLTVFDTFTRWKRVSAAFIPAEALMVFPPMVGIFQRSARWPLRRVPEWLPPDRAAADYHHIIAFRRGVIAALFRRQRFTRFQHRFGDRFSPPRSGWWPRKWHRRAGYWR